MGHPKHASLLLAAAMVWVAAPAGAQVKEVWLRAAPTTVTMPDLAVVTVWGYALDTGPADDGVVSSPGPELALGTGDTSLRVHLKNRLPESTSLVIPGLVATGSPGAPTRGPDGRALSLTGETVPGDTGEYTFAAKAGSFLYHSGSHVQVQVQMGLVGALTKDTASGLAYPGTPTFATDVVLVLTEIDPALHQAVADGEFGPGLAVTSAVHYEPRYFLVNGKPYDPASLPVQLAPVGGRTLLRVFNGTPSTRVPTLPTPGLTILADSGHRLPFPKRQYSVLLPALQTADVLVQPANSTPLVFFDRALGLSSGQGLAGGMAVRLAAASAPAPVRAPLFRRRFGSAGTIPAGIRKAPLRVPRAGIGAR